MAESIETGSTRKYARVTKPRLSPEDLAAKARIARYKAEDTAAEDQMKQRALQAYRQQQMDQMQQNAPTTAPTTRTTMGEGFKKGGKVKKMAKGGFVKAADGIAQRGKTRGRFV